MAFDAINGPVHWMEQEEKSKYIKMSELWIFWSYYMDIEYMEDTEMYTAVYLEFIVGKMDIKL